MSPYFTLCMSPSATGMGMYEAWLPGNEESQASAYSASSMALADAAIFVAMDTIILLQSEENLYNTLLLNKVGFAVKMLFHSLLSCIISDEKCAVTVMYFLYVLCFFFPDWL